jgi:hypothetical protein
MRPSHLFPTVVASCRVQSCQRSVPSISTSAWSPSAPGAGTRSSSIATVNRVCACSANVDAHASSPWSTGRIPDGGLTAVWDLGHGTSIYVIVMLTPDEVAARIWDDYLHRFGVEAYVMVRYISTLPTMPTSDRPLAPDGREEPQSPRASPRVPPAEPGPPRRRSAVR